MTGVGAKHKLFAWVVIFLASFVCGRVFKQLFALGKVSKQCLVNYIVNFLKKFRYSRSSKAKLRFSGYENQPHC